MKYLRGKIRLRNSLGEGEEEVKDDFWYRTLGEKVIRLKEADWEFHLGHVALQVSVKHPTRDV